MLVYANPMVMEILGQFITVLSYLAINYTETGYANCCGHIYVSQAFDLVYICLSVLTINYVDMLVEIVEHACSHRSLIYDMLA